MLEQLCSACSHAVSGRRAGRHRMRTSRVAVTPATC